MAEVTELMNGLSLSDITRMTVIRRLEGRGRSPTQREEDNSGKDQAVVENHKKGELFPHRGIQSIHTDQVSFLLGGRTMLFCRRKFPELH